MTERPSFEEYFLMMAFVVSSRSEDPYIKHGAIIVNNFNHIIGTGYNAAIIKADKSKIDMEDRYKRRPWMIHAEENAILNCTKNPKEIGGASIYITGIPCVVCTQHLVNFGIKKIFYAERTGSITENEETANMRKEIVKMAKLKLKKISISNEWIKKVNIFG